MATSAAAGGQVRTTALPLVKPIPPKGTLTPGESVSLYGDGLFASGSTMLTAAARAQLAVLARELSAAKAIRCEGYTDPSGDPLTNWWLGLARAVTVCNALKADGVKATASIISYGQSRPATTGPNQALNRRVIVFVER